MTRREFIRTAALLFPVSAQAQLNFSDLPFMGPDVLDPIALNWADRVVINGGARPSTNSIVAASVFVRTLRGAGILSKMKTINMVAPDNLIAARTPLIVAHSVDPWPNVGSSNFASADLTLYGLQCNGAKALKTGAIGTDLSLSNAGLTIVASVINPVNGLLYDMGYLNATNNQYMYVAAAQTGGGNTGHAGGSSFSTGQIINTGAANTYAGYIGYNRTSAVRADLYYANNDIAHSSIGNNTNNQSSGITNTDIYWGAVADSGGGAIPYYSKNTLSFGAVHDGLSSSESLAFFNAINTLRTSFGGGWGDIGDQYVGGWIQRILAAGGSAPSVGSQSAVHTLCTSLWSAGIITKFISAIPLVSDSLIAACTPIIKLEGNSSWTNHNFVSGDLTVNGLIGNGSTKYLETGFIPNASSYMTSGSAGLIAYVHTDSATGVQTEIGGYGAAFNSFTGLLTHYNTSHNLWGMWRYSGNGNDALIDWTNPSPATGYYSGQRTATNASAVYFANSGTAHASLATGAGAIAGSPTEYALYGFAANGVGTPTDYGAKRLSFLAITTGMSSADSSAAYTAIQAFRTALGGGYV